MGAASAARPAVGQPYPERWPVRFRPYRARRVHAGSRRLAGGLPSIVSACRGHYEADRPGYDAGELPADREVTCLACARRLAAPLSPQEWNVMVALGEVEGEPVRP